MPRRWLMRPLMTWTPQTPVLTSPRRRRDQNRPQSFRPAMICTSCGPHATQKLLAWGSGFSPPGVCTGSLAGTYCRVNQGRSARRTRCGPLRRAAPQSWVGTGSTIRSLRSRQGLTLVHVSAQLKRFPWDRGCVQGLFIRCLVGFRGN